jgi:hypothetical protein
VGVSQDGLPNGRNRRILPVAVGPGEGLLAERKAGVQPWRREPLKVPISDLGLIRFVGQGVGKVAIQAARSLSVTAPGKSAATLQVIEIDRVGDEIQALSSQAWRLHSPTTDRFRDRRPIPRPISNPDREGDAETRRVDKWDKVRSRFGDLEHPGRAGAHAGAAATAAPFGLGLLALIDSAARSKAVTHASDRDHGPATDDNRITINISHAPVELEMLT